MGMRVLGWMQPRDDGAAVRAVSVLCAVGAAVTVVFAPLQPGVQDAGTAGVAAMAGTVALIAAIALVARSFPATNAVGWALNPLLAIAAIAVVDLITRDSSVAAQIFFVFPILYGASQLRPPGVVVLAVAALVGEAVVVGTQLPAREAIYNGGYVAAALVTTGALLTMSSERQARLVARLKDMAAIDPLTGLMTRRVLDEAATSALSGAGSKQGTSLILLDVDKFKTINDRFGHPCGDEVLVRIAGLLARSPLCGEVACRLGGDEVALLIPDCSLDAAVRRAEEVLAGVREQDFLFRDDEPLGVSVSIGVAHAPSHATDLRALYAAADAALYRAKQGGRSRVAVSDPRAPTGS